MSRDFTLFQFDLDEETVRRILSSIPGVTPLPPDDEPSPNADAPADTGADADTTTSGTTEPSDHAGPVGSEAHLGDDSTRRPTGTAANGGPSTPWPGAPTDEASSEDEEGGLLARFGGKRLLIAVGLVLGLGVIGVAIVWFMKKRGDDSGPAGDDAVDFGAPGDSTDEAADSARADETRSAAEADAESRSYPIDPGPIVGMGFLAVGTLVLRHFRSGDETAA